MPVSISRVCPHCGSTFLAQRQDRIFCSHVCTVGFNNWRLRKMNNAPRSPELVAKYTLARQQLRLAEMKLQCMEHLLEERQAA